MQPLTKKRNTLLAFFFVLSLVPMLSAYAVNSQPPNPSQNNPLSKIDYTFSNPDFTLSMAHQILANAFPQTAQEITDPLQFYNLAAVCYAKKLDKVYYHLVPVNAPRIAYFWFNSPTKGCAFGAYYLGNLEPASGTTRGKICPLTPDVYTYLFSPQNISLVSEYEKSHQPSDAFIVFTKRTLYCLDQHNVTTEQLQSMFTK